MFEWHTGWHMWWMAASWVTGLVVVVLFLWVLLRAAMFQGSGSPPDTPETILKRCYAQGDISTGEYDRRLTALRK